MQKEGFIIKSKCSSWCSELEYYLNNDATESKFRNRNPNLFQDSLEVSSNFKSSTLDFVFREFFFFTVEDLKISSGFSVKII
jgi:hypothetical protein